ncbi:hemolysin [Luteimicrobium album]|uniref:Hemolysin n=1 Tax=Luteimicrobium album TaxID=1054550 RepID=A0ABQ6HZ81_9MICO|nr:choice-of-anchor Q domain-containing protein [Luteimicrobium album]GMA23193.1 hemolysin [Luteimicrobium album]
MLRTASRLVAGLVTTGLISALAALGTASTASAQTPQSPLTGARVVTTGSPHAGHGGRVYYVDATSGKDTNSGRRPSSAWKSLARVDAATLAPGDVVAFHRGDTFAGSATISDAGTAQRPITLTAYGHGDQPVLTNPGQWNMLVLDAPHVQVKNLAFQDGAVFDNADQQGIRGPKYELSGAIAITANGSDTLVQDDTFTDVGVGVKTYGAGSTIDHNTFKDLRIAFRGVDTLGCGCETSYGAIGVSVDNSRVHLTWNDFINCRSTDSPYGADGGAVEIEGFDFPKDDIVIGHNYSLASQGFVEVTETSSSHVRIDYNVSDDYQQFLAWDTTTTPSDYLATNNTIVHQRDRSQLIAQYYYREDGPAPSASWATFRNNIFDSRGSWSFYDFPHDHNLYTDASKLAGFALGTGDLVADPEFADRTTDDLRLTAGSPAIDAGVRIPGATRDLVGHRVPAGFAPDLGAYEYRSHGFGHRA